jgi:oligopeptide transport system ATP-binding protein
MSKLLLEVKDLKTEFRLQQGVVHAVNGVSFRLDQGETLGIVGESGCGKSVTALSIMRLLEGTTGRVAGGQVLLHEDGAVQDLASLPLEQMQRVRGNKISMIFQDPMTSLNPVLTVGHQIMEPLKIHSKLSDKAARDEAVKLLDRVGIPEPELRLKDYPHQFSGGMRQRVMIAMAAACRPRLLIADEPTTALDVTIQAQILDLIRELKETLDTAVIIITHDLGVVAQLADQVAVMYAGGIVEIGPASRIFNHPRHPYTRSLMHSIPRLRDWPDRLATIEGAPPSLTADIRGCPFEPRCAHRVGRCAAERPALLEAAPGHACACWVVQEGGLS